jgi:hypothetical protein
MATNSEQYVTHFGMRIDQTRPTARLNRETYVQVSTRESFHTYAYAKHMINNEEVDNLILDEEKQQVFYTESYCQMLKERALRNYDINMSRFALLDAHEFVDALNSYIAKNHFTEITNLKCNKFSDPYERDIEGYIYIMVLGQYKQVYIGITRSALASRIKQHWNRKKPLDRLVFGSVNTSRISIDCFGALDTSQIFAKPYRGKKVTGLEQLESHYIRAFDQRFVLNRL